MAVPTSAQLTSAITSSQLTFNVQNIVIPTGSTGFPVVGAAALPIGYPTLIDAEIFFTIAQPTAGTIIVRGRGSDGTAAVAHDVLANIYTSSNAADFGAVPSGIVVTIDPTDDVVISVGQDGALPLPTSNTVYNINKATALAGTFAAPSLVDNGVTAVITSQTAAAHVITATGLLRDGTTATGNTLTFTAVAGASVTLIAANGFWNVGSRQNVTVA